VLEATQVRNLDVAHLFVAGLSEASFPSSRNDDCLYNESERRRLNENGLSLGHRTSRNQDEMLLFYSIVTRARERLVLSYPAVSAAGQPLFPSPYMRAIEDLFEPGELPVSPIGELDPVPSENQILTAADLRLVATHDVRGDRPGLFRGMLESPNMSPAAANILASVVAAVHRFGTQGLTSYEGMLSIARHKRELRKMFPDDHEYSATKLEKYAECPFRFFVSEILKVEPLESPDAQTDYRARGTLVHNVLCALHRQATEIQSESAQLTSAEISARFRELTAEQLGRRVDETELEKAFTRVEELLLEEWASAYAGQHEEYVTRFGKQWDAPPVATHFEVPFGQPPEQAGDADQPRLDALTVGSPDRQIQIGGRIDRIDVGTTAGQKVFNIIDYKTGSPPRFTLDDVASGRSVQLALYLLAVGRLRIVEDDAAPYQMGFWSLKETGFVAGLKGRQKPEQIDQAILESLEKLLDEMIPKLTDAISNGQFPVYNADENCTGRCSYRTVCRVNQVRALEARLGKTWSLEAGE
jgi:ATP-dependent helicase/DNAse subunit B